MQRLHRQLVVGQSQGQLLGGGEAEVPGHQLAQRRRGPSTVPCPDRSAEPRQADRITAAPVAGHLAEGEEALLPAIRMHPDGVDPSTRDEGDAPALRRPSAQRRQRVVADLGAAAQTPCA